MINEEKAERYTDATKEEIFCNSAFPKEINAQIDVSGDLKVVYEENCNADLKFLDLDFDSCDGEMSE